MTLWQKLCSLAFLSILAFGCAVEEQSPPTEELATLEQPIYGGDPVVFSNGQCVVPHHCSVVGLHSVTKRGVYTVPFCSGTWIAPRKVLTAGHCVFDKKSRTKTIATSAVRIYVNPDDAITSNDANFLSHLVNVQSIALHPGYNNITLVNDIAVITLAADVPAGSSRIVPKLPAALGFTEADNGILPLDFAGYGITESYNNTGHLESVNHYPFAGVGCAGLPGCSGADPATTFAYSQVNAIGPCSGDSGGPAFIQRNNTWYVAGVTSWGDAYCTSFGISTRVDAYDAWIGN